MQAQDSATQWARVDGIVRESSGKPVEGASVFLHEEGRSDPAETRTSAEGTFRFSPVRAGTYTIKVQKSGFADATEDSLKLSPAQEKHCEFVLQTAAMSAPPPSTGAPSSSIGIELDDRPNFTVAGITDSTGSGGHGSETRIRTGEVLAKETLTLESGGSKHSTSAKSAEVNSEMHESEGVLRAAQLQSPRSFDANHRLGEFYLHSERCHEAIPLLETAHQLNPRDHVNIFDLAQAFKACGDFTQGREHVNHVLAHDKRLGSHDEADLRRLLADLDERLEDPLGAVREYERAANLDSTEQNYFAWGSELLLHAAAAPAIEVFGKGARLHPDSARMLAGLGAALYTSGSTDEAARRLCEAAHLDPSDPAPYLFLGKMQEAAPTSLPCAEENLARFARDQPSNALANYYYALALWKQDRSSMNSDSSRHAEALLERAATLDPKLDVAYVQLGNLYFARGALPEAIGIYQRAIVANPGGSEAHYRLGLAYKRTRDEAKAHTEFAEFKQLEKTEAATLERQRRELRQFLFVLKDQSASSSAISK